MLTILFVCLNWVCSSNSDLEVNNVPRLESGRQNVAIYWKFSNVKSSDVLWRDLKWPFSLSGRVKHFCIPLSSQVPHWNLSTSSPWESSCLSRSIRVRKVLFWQRRRAHDVALLGDAWHQANVSMWLHNLAGTSRGYHVSIQMVSPPHCREQRQATRCFHDSLLL